MDTQIRKAWKNAANIGCALVMLLLPLSSARGDAVSEWNAIAERMVASSEQHPARAARHLAAVRTAMFETMNFIEGRYIPRFLVGLPAPLDPSGEVAAVGAAHYVLAQLYPGQKAALDTALERFLATFPNRETASRTRIWGRHLGGNVYAVWHSDGPSTGVNAPAAARDLKMSRVRASSEESGTGGDAWNSIATRSIEGRMLQPIERARIYALVSLAASEAFSAADDAKSSYGSTVPCVSCAVGAAIRVILETEFGSANESSPGEAYLMPVRNDADESRSAKAAEEMGRKIGLQTLTYYRRVK